MCCSPKSSLTSAVQAAGLIGRRFTLETGHDLSKSRTEKSLLAEVRKKRPLKAWLSVPCTAWSCAQNGNKKTKKQRGKLERKRAESRSLLKKALAILGEIVKDPTADAYFEWPANCHGWQVPELKAFRAHCTALGRPVHRVLVHGCAYGLRSQASPGKFLRKSWAIETTDPAFQESVGKKCPGNHHHQIIMGNDTAYSAYYPPRMARAIARHWARSA